MASYSNEISLGPRGSDWVSLDVGPLTLWCPLGDVMIYVGDAKPALGYSPEPISCRTAVVYNTTSQVWAKSASRDYRVIQITALNDVGGVIVTPPSPGQNLPPPGFGVF